MENLQNIENSDEINEFDEFDIMAARDWVNALIASENNRQILDKLNNQIQTVPTEDNIQILTGIEMLADLLGAELRKVQPEGSMPNFAYFDYNGKIFIQYGQSRSMDNGKEAGNDI